jgi:bacteriorhodopsin
MKTPLPSTAVSQPYYFVPENDIVGLTFFFSTFALLAAALFFFLERRNVPKRWTTNVTLAGIICLVAAISYYYMQGMYVNLHVSPTHFRYIDWLITVPLMCAQFYLLLRPAGASVGSLCRLVVGGIWTIAFGYYGEVSDAYWSIVWGGVSTLGYLLVLYEVWFGPLAKVVERSTNEEVVRAYQYLGYFVMIGWAVYPLGYMTLPFNVFESLHINRNLAYNLGDVVNKLGFGLVVYSMARKAANSRKKSRAALAEARGLLKV